MSTVKLINLVRKRIQGVLLVYNPDITERVRPIINTMKNHSNEVGFNQDRAQFYRQHIHPMKGIDMARN